MFARIGVMRALNHHHVREFNPDRKDHHWGHRKLAHQPMTQSVYNIVKAPLGWLIYCDGVKLGGVYGSKEAALEAATVAATFAVREGAGIQINVPSAPESDEIPRNWIAAIK
jgi:hypothetical protein